MRSVYPKNGRDGKQQICDLRIPRDVKAVLLTVYSHTNHAIGEAWPSLKTLSAKTGYSRRGLQYLLRRLERGKMLRVRTRSRVTNRQTSNGYRLLCVNHQEASQARVKNGSTSCTPLKVSKKGLKERKLLPVQVDIVLLREEYMRERKRIDRLKADFLKESETFRKNMRQAWALVGEFKALPRDQRRFNALIFKDFAQSSRSEIPFRMACERLHIRWRMKSQKVKIVKEELRGKASASTRPKKKGRHPENYAHLGGYEETYVRDCWA